MTIDTLFIDGDCYLITIDEVTIGTKTCSIGDAIVIKAWLRNNINKLEALFATKRGWGVLQEIEIMGETRGDAQ